MWTEHEVENLREENREMRRTIQMLSMACGILIQENQSLRIDKVTGLPHRNEQSENEIRRLIKATQRHDGLVGFIYCDADGLKKTNDKHGHVVGDELLRITGMAIQHSIRPEDLGFRWTKGDEFLLVIQLERCSMDPTEVLKKIIRRIQHMMSEIKSAYPEVKMEVSAGYALMESHEDPFCAIRRAEQEMYKEKARRKAPK